MSDTRWGFTRQGLDFTGGNTGPGLQLVGMDDFQNYYARNNSRKLPVHNLTEDLTWAVGKHTMQFGVNFRNIHNKRFTEEKSYPFYRSNNGWMENLGLDVLPADIDESFQFPYVQAQMALLGTIDQSEVSYFVNRDGTTFPRPHVPRREFINNEFEWYVQDQWKLSRGLTLTAGLRYSYFAPPYEKNGYQVRADFDVNEWFARRRDRGAAGIPSNANPVLSFVLAGKANNAPPTFDPDKNNFAPRIALAWSPSFSNGPLHTLLGDAGQSSIRLGFAMFYDRTGGTSPITTDLYGAIGLATFLRNPVGELNYGTAPRFAGLDSLASLPVPPAPASGFPATPEFTGNTGFMVDTKLRTPYSTTFNLSISRELPRNFMVEASYIGRVGRKLLVQSDFAAPLVNFKDSQSGQTWIEAAGILANLTASGVPLSEVPRIPFLENVFAPLATSEMTASQAVYELAMIVAPSWTDILHILDTPPGGSTIYGQHTFFQQQFDWLPAWTNLGQSSYHSLQLVVRKRIGDGIQADFNYTLAKSMDNGSSVEDGLPGAGQIPNAFNHRQALSYSDFDIRHQINSNFTLDLPIGRNRRFGGKRESDAEYFIGGMEVGWPAALAYGISIPHDLRQRLRLPDKLLHQWSTDSEIRRSSARHEGQQGCARWSQHFRGS